MVFISWISRIARGDKQGINNRDKMMFQRPPRSPPPTNDTSMGDIGQLIGVNNGHTRGGTHVEGESGDVEQDASIVSESLMPTRETEVLQGKKWIVYLKRHGYWSILMEGIGFLIHFFFVMLLLFLGAMAFVWLEDPEPPLTTTASNVNNTLNYTTKNIKLPNVTFWENVVMKYNLTIDDKTRLLLMKEFRLFIREDEKRKSEMNEANKEQKDRRFIFLKWFYFVTIATTTIGYGDISPKTDNGKLFYIFFSIIGIGLMMTLLKKCGAIISAANTKLYGLIDKHLRRGQSCVSNELLTSLSITIIFILYLVGGIYYGKESDAIVDWSIIDLCYYWIVTFTTVGFGDIAPPIEKEIENIYFYVIYRIFGLAFLAALIDALSEYAEQRKKYFDKKQAEFREKMHDLSANMPTMPSMPTVPSMPGGTSKTLKT